MTHSPNAVVRPVVEYLPDWHGAALFSSLTGAAAASLNSGRAITPGNATFSGWVRPLQRFTGQVAALGHARAVVPKSSTLNAQKTTDDVTAANIFRERMARGLG
jgi:hypothetical protein